MNAGVGGRGARGTATVGPRNPLSAADPGHDLLAALDLWLAAARQEAARAVDRVDALVALRSHALDVAHRLHRPLSPEDVFTGRTAEEQAHIDALRDRIVPPET